MCPRRPRSQSVRVSRPSRPTPRRPNFSVSSRIRFSSSQTTRSIVSARNQRACGVRLSIGAADRSARRRINPTLSPRDEGSGECDRLARSRSQASGSGSPPRRLSPFATMHPGELGADVVKIEVSRSGNESRRYGPPGAKPRTSRKKKSVKGRTKKAGQLNSQI